MSVTEKEHERGVCWNILLVICVILLPPLAVFLNEKTLRSSHFWVCLLLTILGWIAGVIYGIYEIWFSHSNGTARKPKAADVHHGEQRPVV